MNQATSPEQQKKYGQNTFIFLAVFLAAILLVIIVAGFSFTVWISQMFSAVQTLNTLPIHNTKTVERLADPSRYHFTS